MTTITGLRGIVRDNRIRLDGHLHELSNREGDVCRKCGGISVLDLESAREEHLFRTWQNWLHVFTYHVPTVVLILSPDIKHNLFRFDTVEAAKIPGRYIVEAEACHKGDIPAACITEGWVMGKNYRIIFRSAELSEVLSTVLQLEKKLKWRKPTLWNCFAGWTREVETEIAAVADSEKSEAQASAEKHELPKADTEVQPAAERPVSQAPERPVDDEGQDSAGRLNRAAKSQS